MNDAERNHRYDIADKRDANAALNKARERISFLEWLLCDVADDVEGEGYRIWADAIRGQAKRAA